MNRFKTTSACLFAIVILGSTTIAAQEEDALHIDEDGNTNFSGIIKGTDAELSGSIKAANAEFSGAITGLGASVPGMIVMWAGDKQSIPPGWVYCDGNSGTPDLRRRSERYIMRRFEGDKPPKFSCLSGRKIGHWSDGTVKQCSTSLIWLYYGSDILGGPNPGRHNPCPVPTGGRMNYNQAVAFVSQLKDGVCGLRDGSRAGDWRLPAAHELTALNAQGEPSWALQRVPFWSSSSAGPAIQYAVAGGSPIPQPGYVPAFVQAVRNAF